MSDHAAFKLKLDEFFAQRALSDVWTWLMLNEDASREEIEERLEERLRWAHLHRNDAEYATEANFLLNYMDEIRVELLPGSEWEEDSSTVVVERPSAPRVVATKPIAADPTMMPTDFDDPFAPVGGPPVAEKPNLATLGKDPASKGRPASFSVADTADDRPTDPGLKKDPHTASFAVPVVAPVDPTAPPAPAPAVAPVVAAPVPTVAPAAPAPVAAAPPAAAPAPVSAAPSAPGAAEGAPPPASTTPYPARPKSGGGASSARIILIGGGLLIGAAIAFFAVTRLFHVEPEGDTPGATAPATTAPATTAPATTPPPATPPVTPNPASTGPRPAPAPGTLPGATPATPGAKPPATTPAPTPTTPPATTAPNTKPATTGTTARPTTTTGTTTRPTTTTGTTTRPETTASTEVVCLAKGTFRGSSGENRVSMTVSSIKGRGVSGSASIATAGGTKTYPYSGICTGSSVRLIADGQIFLSGNVSGNGTSVSGSFRWGDQSGQMTISQR